MSLPITEAVVLTLQSGASPDEALNGLSQILHHQAGFQRFRWGQWKESSDKLQLLIGKNLTESWLKISCLSRLPPAKVNAN
jgi:hypothetical protein